MEKIWLQVSNLFAKLGIITCALLRANATKAAKCLIVSTMQEDEYLLLPVSGEPGRPLLLLQITDTHIRTDPDFQLLGLNTAASFKAVMDLAKRHYANADLVLASGDLVHDDSSAYPQVAQQYQRLNCPSIALPGNHDEAQALLRRPSDAPLHWVRSVDIGGWRIINLDSSIMGEPGGHLRSSELEALQDAINNAENRFILICVHHPPVPVGSLWLDAMQIDNPEPLWKLADQTPELRAIVFGHVHQEYECTYAGVKLLGTPSTCIQFKDLSATFALDTQTPGLRWLKLYEDGQLESGIHRIDQYPDNFVPSMATGY